MYNGQEFPPRTSTCWGWSQELEPESELELELARPQFTTVCTMPDTVALATPPVRSATFSIPITIPIARDEVNRCALLCALKLLEAK